MEALIKLFALACKTDHESRALEICRLMDDDTIQLAIKYASKLTWLFVASGFFWLIIMLVITMNDYSSRGWM